MKNNLVLLSFILLLSSFHSMAEEDAIDSLLHLLKNDKADTTKVVHLNILSREYTNVGSFDTSITLAKQALELSNRLSPVYNGGIADACNNLGNANREKGNYPAALDYYLRALKLDEIMQNKLGIAKRLGNIGNLYYNQSDYSKAINYYTRALNIAEELGDKGRIAANLGNMGNVYKDMKVFDKALDLYERSLEIKTGLKDENEIAKTLGNIGSVYYGKKDYDKALEYEFRILKLSEDIGDLQLLNTTMTTIGQVFTEQKKYKQAFYFLYRALAVDDSIGMMDGVKEDYNCLSALYEFSNISLPDSIGGRPLPVDQMRTKALYYYKRYISIKDSIFSEESRSQLVEKEMSYEFEKKEAKTQADHEKQVALAEAENKKQRIITWAVLGGLVLATLFAGFVLRSLRITRSQKQIIEIKNRETEIQKEIIEEQKKIVESKNKNITDSITYALTIQESILPPASLFREAFSDSFILYSPKDIVSGDFYWLRKMEDGILLGAIDCTGHGVPGAFMSLHGYNHLESIVNEKKIFAPAAILDALNTAVMQTLRQDDGSEIAKHGMDMSLVKIDNAKGTLSFSGAKNNVFILSDGALAELKADRMSVGNKFGRNFSVQEVNIKKGDMIYLFSDGYVDQKGGAENKRFLAGRFKELLQKYGELNCSEQKKNISEAYQAWKAGHEQIDDVMVIGIRI